MENTSSFPLPEHVTAPLLSASNSLTLLQSLQSLIETAKSNHGRKHLASANILPSLIRLIHSRPCNDYLLLSLKLLRNLCAGEIANQNSFIEEDGVETVLSVLSSRDSDHAILRMGLQILANVSLAGERHQLSVWTRFFPNGFIELANVPTRQISDPLCMILYTCCDGSQEIAAQLSSDCGLALLAEIVRTTSAVGFGEDWFMILLSRICIDEAQIGLVFAKLGDVNDINSNFSQEQAFLLKTTSDIINERLEELTIHSDITLFVLEIFKKSTGILDSLPRTNSSLPTGNHSVDVLGYSLTILRDICARSDSGSFKEDSNTLFGLLDLLLNILRELEPPEIIRKCAKQSENTGNGNSSSLKPCPYKGFRRDIVSVIGNCAFQRKSVQDQIREKEGILLMLQQCVIDEDNPYLREWGIWSARNLLEGNEENQRFVSDLENMGSVDVPELVRLGLRVEVDQKTQRPKLVNVS